MAATYKDIQRLTGFSLSTISRHFNGEKVKPATRIAIEKAASALDFKMNDFARGLKSRKAMSVGLLIPDLNSAFCTTVMYQVGRLLRQRGYGCLVCDCNSDKQTEIEAVNFLLRKSVDGIINIPTDADPAHLYPARAMGVPIVLIDRAIPLLETDAVVIDNEEGGRRAAEYLRIRGHRQVAVTTGPEKLGTMAERMAGFLGVYVGQDAHHAHVIGTDSTIAGGYQAVKALVDAHRGATALFCTNYELTLGAVAAMNELGLRFPDDLSLIGFDNMQLTGIIKPSLTLVEQPMEQIARCATDLLFERLANPARQHYQTVVCKSGLIEGASVADLGIDAVQAE